MPWTTEFDGVLFVEGDHPGARRIRQVNVKIGGILTSAQLQSLEDVKRLLAKEVASLGGNALLDFRYGQRSVGGLASLFSRDDVSWFGTGVAAQVTAG